MAAGPRQPRRLPLEEGRRVGYISSTKHNWKVLDFIQFGGPKCTVLRTFRWEVQI